jgi:Protein of unknown function (DUF3168)
MSSVLTDLRTAVLSRLAQDQPLLGLVPVSRHFEQVPKHAAAPWLALGAVRLFDNGSSQSAGHRIELHVLINARPKQSDIASAIADRIAAAVTPLDGPAGGIHIVDIQAKEQSLAPHDDEEDVRLTLTLIAITEPV